MLGVLDDLDLAATARDLLYSLLVAHRHAIEAFGHPGVGLLSAAFHRVVELGNEVDPVADGARRHAEEFGQLGLGGAEPAVVAGKRAVFGLEGGGTADGAHVRHISTVVTISITELQKLLNRSVHEFLPTGNGPAVTKMLAVQAGLHPRRDGSPEEGGDEGQGQLLGDTPL
jgi:hypothetical protein